MNMKTCKAQPFPVTWIKPSFRHHLATIRQVLTIFVFVASLLGMNPTSVKAATTITFTAEELLGKPTDTSITINIVPASTIEYHYQYGTTSGSYTGQTSNTTATGGQPHEVTISGLSPNTQYYYRMRYHLPGETDWVNRTEHSFWTQRAQGSTFTFTVTSDSHATFNTSHQQAMTNILNDLPDFTIDLGDTFYPASGTTTQTAVNNAYLAYRELAYMDRIGHSIPIFLSPGNHEEEEGWNLDDTPFSIGVGSLQARKAYFPTPIDDGFYSGNTDPLARIDEETYGDEYREDYYAWEWGDALFVVIDEFQYTMNLPYTPAAGEGSDDSMTGDQWSWTLGEQQYNWLRQTLETSAAKYKFVFSHNMLGGIPRGPIGGAGAGYVRGGAEAAAYFEWGGKNADGTWGFDTHRPGWYAPIHQLFVENGVSAYFHGHDHQYVYETRDGIVYQEVPSPSMTGSGFSGIYTEGTYTDYRTIEMLPNSGHLRITVNPAEATVDYVRSNQTGVSYTYTIEPNVSGPTHTLTTAVNPSAGGTVNPAAGPHEYEEGSVVNVTATANTGYTFSNWSGACSGSGACSVTMDADKTVTANFTAAPTYTLTTAVSPSGGGTINPSAGAHTYNSGQVVAVTATANSGYVFANWSGACTGTGACSVTMNANKTVTANFNASGTPITFTGTELLGRLEANSASISVVPDSAISLYYQYGTTSGVYTGQTTTTTAAAGTPKVVVISGLTANTRYYYRMQYSTNGGSTWTARPEHTFQTQRAPGSTFTFDVTTDSHINIQLGNASNWTSTLNGVASDAPDFLIDLGDTFAMDNGSTNVTLGDTAAAEQKYKDGLPYFNTVSASSAIYLVPGNHEQQEAWHLTASNTGGNPAISLPVMAKNAEKKYFLNPVNDSFYSGDTGTYSYLSGDQLKQDYYSWTWGDALFVVISPFWTTTTKPYTTLTGGGESDTTGSDNRWDWTLGQTQFNWLKTTLQNSNAKYKFVFAHQIVGGDSASSMVNYGHGGVNSANLVEWGGYNVGGSVWAWDTNRSGWGSQPIRQMMEASGVTAFFHGHDHQMAYESLNGMVYQSVPSGSFTGSFGIYTTGGNSGNTIWADSTQGPGHLKVTVGPSQTTVDFIRYNASSPAYSYTMAPTGGPSHTLTLAVDPSGAGTTTPAVGAHSYVEGSIVTVTATRASGYQFDHWSGACTGSGACQVTMDADKSVTAHFVVGPAAVTLDGAASSGTGAPNASSVTFSHTTGTGTNRLMLVGVSWNCGTTDRTISSATFTPSGGSATSLNLVKTQQYTFTQTSGTAYRYSAIYRLLAPPSGVTGTINITFSGSVTNGIIAGAANFAGVDQTTPLGTSGGAGGTSSGTPATPTVTLTGLNGNELVFDNVFIGASSTSQTMAADSGQSELWNVLGYSSSATSFNMRSAASTKEATSSSVTMSWTPGGYGSTATRWAIAAVPIRPASTNNHTVTFNANGGTGTMSPQIANVPTALTLNAFTRTGYSFAGWNTASNGSGTSYANGATYSFSADITLYAQWTALANHTVTFNANGGTGTMAPQVANVPTALTLNTFTRTGYTFAGWNTASNGSGTAYADGATYSFAADITLYAQWTANTYTVTFNANGGTTASPTSKVVTFGSAYGTLATTSRTGYTLAGWFTAASGGTQVTTATIVNTASNHTLYAQWTTLPTHTVTFNANGGTGTMAPQVANVPTALTLNTFTRTGYNFAGWNTAANGSGTAYADGATYSFATDVTLYAQWTANTYTVTFNANGGSTPDPTSKVVTFGSTYGTLATTTRTGYNLAGWFTAASGGTQVTAASTVTTASNHTLYAQWTALPNHTVTFNANGGSGTMTSQTANVPTALTLNTFTRAAYSFAGWDTQAGGGGTSYADGATYSFAADITLYAQWSDIVVPPLPSSFYGEIHIYDSPPTVGNLVEAYLPGVSNPAATTAISQSGSDLVYSFNVPAGAKGAATEGDQITFKINGRIMATGVWHSGTNVRLDFHPPQALPGGPYTGDEDAAIAFSGSAQDWSTDVSTYQWDWDNDGTYDATGQNPSHTWANPGNYTVGLKVTDAQGGEGTATTSVSVNQVSQTHSIALVAGWNLISFNVHPADTSPASVLSSIAGNYDLVYAWDATGAHSGSGNWTKYDPAGPPYGNTLTDLNERMGFWIHMTVADTLEVTGTIPTTSNITLSTAADGWNLVSYPASVNRPLPDALRDHGVGTDFSLVYAYHANDGSDPWKLFDRAALPYVNDLTQVTPGWGYWIKVSADHTWSVEFLED